MVESLSTYSVSCAGLTRASINLHKMLFAKGMDCRVKPGNDSMDDWYANAAA
jgi:hypothetical protein